MKTLWILFASLLAVSVGSASAEVTACREVKTVPFTINKPGVWCLKKNLTYKSATGQAILIARSNVVLDLNGFRLFGKGGPSSTAVGIYADNKTNITVRNGTVQGFERGIYLDESGTDASYGHLIEHIRAVRNYFTGIEASGEDLLVRHNQVLQTGDGDNQINAYGIFLNDARGAHVHDNTVTHTSETSGARGIVVITGYEIIIRQNVVTDLRTATARWGIQLQGVNTASVYGNQITSLSSVTGIRASGSTDVSCFNNVIDGFTNAHSTCDNFTGNLP